MRNHALLLLLLVATTEASATWYYPNVEEGSDIVMVDVRWPYWPNGTYFALWNMATYPEGGPFYGGVAPYGPGKDAAQELQDAYEPQLVWSFWGSPNYGGDRARPIYSDAPFYGGSMSGEGATAGICGYFPYLRPNRWMRMVMRAWPSLDDPDGRGYVGWWVQDVELDRWRLVGVVSVPCKVRGFAGNACFVEDCGAERPDRLFDRRLGYHRLDGAWRKTDSIWVDGAVPKTRFRLAEDDTVLRFEMPEPAAPAEEPLPKHHYTVRQPGTPTLDQPAIGEASARGAEGQVVVEWTVPADAAPQLRYKVELFASDGASGAPIAAIERALPYVRVESLTGPVPAHSARLTIGSIFDQQVSRVIPVTTPAFLPAATAGKLRPGLRFRYYEAPEGVDWKRIPDVSAMRPLRQGVVNSLDDTISLGRTTLYAMCYTGFFRAPATGIYVFQPRTCDGSRLGIDGQFVADNDGVHSPTIRRYAVALAEGLHAIEFDYFKSSYGAMDDWLSEKLRLDMEGPGLPPRSLGHGDFLCQADDAIPTIDLDAPASGAVPGNHFVLKPNLDLRGQAFERVEYYRDRTKLGESTAGGEGGAGVGAFETILPHGDNRLWARLWYGDSSAVDSNVANCPAIDVREGPWQFTVVGEQGLPQGVSTSATRVALVGEGMVFSHRATDGDFVLTGRIVDFAHTTASNGINERSWMGLVAAADPEQPWGSSFGLWDTAGRGLRGAPDDRDLEGSGTNRDDLGSEDRWVRIARRGMRLMAYTSPDGQAWRKVIDRIDRGFPPQLRVGVALWTIPGKNRSIFHGALDSLDLQQPGVLPEEPRTPITAEDRNLPGRLTGLVRGAKDRTFYARGNGTGVWASASDGETWLPRNGGLAAPEALAVRSVAVCPEDPSLIVRGGGCVSDGAAVSGLWRSVDAGATWSLVSREIDFDGAGPDGYFGEVIAFDPSNPSVVAAGGESSGLYLSTDRGATWQYADLAGERISCLAFSPYNKGLLLVGTCAAGELTGLGLGASSTVGGGVGRIYGFTGQGGSKVLYAEMPDLGVANIAFESIAEGSNYVYFATTRGLYYTFDLRGFYQRRAGVAPDVPYVALNEWSGGGRGRSRILAGPLSGAGEGLLYAGSVGYFWSPVWERRSQDVPGLNEALTSVASHPTEADTFLICTREGILKTTDGGNSYRLVLGATPGSASGRDH